VRQIHSCKSSLGQDCLNRQPFFRGPDLTYISRTTPETA